MTIEWSALRVSEAMDMVEEYVNQVVELQEQVRIVAREARNTPNLPRYVDRHLCRLIAEVDRAIGDSQWEPAGPLKAGIQSIRDSLLDSAVKDEKNRAESGRRPSLVA